MSSCLFVRSTKKPRFHFQVGSELFASSSNLWYLVRFLQGNVEHVNQFYTLFYQYGTCRIVYFPFCSCAMYSLDLLPSDLFTHTSPVFIAVTVALKTNKYTYQNKATTNCVISLFHWICSRHVNVSQKAKKQVKILTAQGNLLCCLWWCDDLCCTIHSRRTIFRRRIELDMDASQVSLETLKSDVYVSCFPTKLWEKEHKNSKEKKKEKKKGEMRTFFSFLSLFQGLKKRKENWLSTRKALITFWTLHIKR